MAAVALDKWRAIFQRPVSDAVTTGLAVMTRTTKKEEALPSMYSFFLAQSDVRVRSHSLRWCFNTHVAAVVASGSSCQLLRMPHY